jgi:predicted nucleic acid-binding protein
VAPTGVKLTIDTNLYIDAARDERARAALRTFSAAAAPFLYLTGVVAQELLMGVRPGEERDLERDLFLPFERRGRVLAPSYAMWKRSGEVIAELVARHGFSLAQLPRSFVNDVHLACTCREHGTTLVTANTIDFGHIAAVLPGFTFREPWPGL